jgi:transposase-like protein
MPRRGETTLSAAKIERAVKRHLEGGELVVSLSKEFKVSRQTFYNWLEAYKRQAVERIERKGVSKVELEKTAKADLIAQNEILHSENRKLRDRLVNLMIKHGEIP